MGIDGIGGSGEMRMNSAQFAQKRFERLDVDADGGINKSEFSRIAEKKGLDVDEVFTQYDVNEDGKLDKTEEAELFAAHKPKGPPPPPPGGTMGQTEEAEDTFQTLLDALASEESNEDENSLQSLLQSFLQKSGSGYSNSGLFSSSSSVSTFSAVG